MLLLREKKQQQMLNCQYHMKLNIWCPCQERLSLNTLVGCSCGRILKRFLVRYSWDLWDQWAMNSQSSVTSICSHVICCESECDSNILFLFVWVSENDFGFNMTNVYFYHRSGLNSRPNSPHVMSGDRYRRNHRHRGSGVERLSMNDDNLPPPPK